MPSKIVYGDGFLDSWTFSMRGHRRGRYGAIGVDYGDDDLKGMSAAG